MKRAYEEASAKEEYKFYSMVMRCLSFKKTYLQERPLTVSNGEIFFKANVHFKFIIKKIVILVSPGASVGRSPYCITTIFHTSFPFPFLTQ
jgi:hypothetical protein